MKNVIVLSVVLALFVGSFYGVTIYKELSKGMRPLWVGNSDGAYQTVTIYKDYTRKEKLYRTEIFIRNVNTIKKGSSITYYDFNTKSVHNAKLKFSRSQLWGNLYNTSINCKGENIYFNLYSEDELL